MKWAVVKPLYRRVARYIGEDRRERAGRHPPLVCKLGVLVAVGAAQVAMLRDFHHEFGRM
jgi:hypothetical protein